MSPPADSLERRREQAPCAYWRERPLHLAKGERERLVRWARAAAPREAAGMLLARQDGRAPLVVRVARLPNRARVCGRFRLAPEHVVRLERTAGRMGLTIAGVWHSHPTGDCFPSAADRREGANWRHHVIVALSAGGSVLRRFERVPE